MAKMWIARAFGNVTATTALSGSIVTSLQKTRYAIDGQAYPSGVFLPCVVIAVSAPYEDGSSQHQFRKRSSHSALVPSA